MQNTDAAVDVIEPHSRSCNVVFAPPIFWLPDRRSYVPDEFPDPLRLDSELAALGIRSSVIDPHSRPLNPFAGMASLLQSLDPLRALRILTFNRRADFIISVFEGAALPLLLLRRIMFFRPRIILWDIALTEDWRLRRRILDFVVPRCDGIMVLNSSQLRYIKSNWRPNGPIVVIGHRVDTKFFHPMGFIEGGPILAVGDDTGRDFDTLVKAMAGLPARLELKTRRQVAPADNVSIIRERISYLELRALYARSQFVVVPLHSTLNASGVSTILEAGAMGKALIVSDSQAIADFIVPNETCLVVPQHDAISMRRAIEQLLSDASLRRRLGENARRFIENNCSEAVFAARFAGALHRLRTK